jgi:hypothetical protein
MTFTGPLLDDRTEAVAAAPIIEAEAGCDYESVTASFVSSSMGRAGIEPATLGLKVPCSTN